MAQKQIIEKIIGIGMRCCKCNQIVMITPKTLHDVIDNSNKNFHRQNDHHLELVLTIRCKKCYDAQFLALENEGDEEKYGNNGNTMECL